MTENPYASPESSPDPPSQAKAQTFKWLKAAAYGLMGIGSLELIGSAIAIVIFPMQIALALTLHVRTDYHPAFIALQFLLALAIFIRGVIMVVGAWHMRSGENYRRARTGAIASLVGILFPLTWYSVPFGIWAYILLRRDKYKQLFESK